MAVMWEMVNTGESECWPNLAVDRRPGQRPLCGSVERREGLTHSWPVERG